MIFTGVFLIYGVQVEVSFNPLIQVNDFYAEELLAEFQGDLEF